MSVRDVLIEARALIDRPGKWCQNVLAVDGKMCAGHAVYVAVEGRRGLAKFAMDALALATPGREWRAHPSRYQPMAEVACFNDTHTHAEVMELFDRGIEAAPAL